MVCEVIHIPSASSSLYFSWTYCLSATGNLTVSHISLGVLVPCIIMGGEKHQDNAQNIDPQS